MAACPSLEELHGYLTRTRPLGPDQIERIESHIETCDACQEVLDQLTAGLPADPASTGWAALDARLSQLLAGLPPGTTMPDLGPGYRVTRFLGAGTFGEVWLAQDLHLPRRVAVKTLKMGINPDQRAHLLAALRHDAHLLVDVEHPNIVRVYTWLTVHDQHYLVLQYVEGGSLADRLRRDGPFDWQRAARYVADVGEGLIEVHARGIVHRDVKPANILWDPERDEALLTDFGVAARLGDPQGVAGSLPYMAPEAFDGAVAPALDVYSLAATLFHLVTGSAPFPGPEVSALKRQSSQGLPDPDPRCARLPEPLERVLRAGLAPAPEQRPGLRAFVHTLRGTLNQLLADTLAPPPAMSQRPAPVNLRLTVSREVSPGDYEPVATTHPQPGLLTRDIKKVPRPPAQVHLRTGDRVRIEAVADQKGYITVFNIGPSGILNLLHPDDLSNTPALPVPAHRPLRIVDLELTPPAGRERLFAVWSRAPLLLRPDQLQSLAERGEVAGSRPYRATRDMKRMQHSVQQIPPEDWYAVVLELDHRQ